MGWVSRASTPPGVGSRASGGWDALAAVGRAMEIPHPRWTVCGSVNFKF